MLFMAPEILLEALNLVWVDETIIQVTWKNTLSSLLKEWEQLTLAVCYCVMSKLEFSLSFTQNISQSTVMLAVSVIFLAVPGVVVSNPHSNITSTSQNVVFTSPAQFASCISILASAGSVMTSLLLLRYNQVLQKVDMATVVSVQHDLGLCSQLMTPRQATYLNQNVHPIYGLEPMAIVFALPWALFMWS